MSDLSFTLPATISGLMVGGQALSLEAGSRQAFQIRKGLSILDKPLIIASLGCALWRTAESLWRSKEDKSRDLSQNFWAITALNLGLGSFLRSGQNPCLMSRFAAGALGPSAANPIKMMLGLQAVSGLAGAGIASLGLVSGVTSGGSFLDSVLQIGMLLAFNTGRPIFPAMRQAFRLIPGLPA